MIICWIIPLIIRGFHCRGASRADDLLLGFSAGRAQPGAESGTEHRLYNFDAAGELPVAFCLGYLFMCLLALLESVRTVLIVSQAWHWTKAEIPVVLEPAGADLGTTAAPATVRYANMHA